MTTYPDFVKAEQFYQDDGDKIKLNWLCYEYANDLYLEIKDHAKLTRFRERNSEEQISAFCAYYAKRMRNSIYKRNTEAVDAVAIAESYVYEFYPRISRIQTQYLMEAAVTAWEKLILQCNVCRERCLLECFELTPLFDNLMRP